MGKKLSQAVFTFNGMAKQIPKPIVNALNKTADHIRVLASKEVAKHYTIKQRDAKSMTRVFPRAHIGSFHAAVRAESRLLTPYHFKYTPTTGITTKSGTGWKNSYLRPTTTVTIKKGNKQSLRHAFVAVIRGTRNVYARKEGGKKIVSLRSVSLPQMIANEKVSSEIYKDVTEFYEKKFMQEFNFVAEKAGFK